VARQYLQDGGLLCEPSITDPFAASATTTAEGVWNSLQYCLIPAYDPRPGKVYCLEAGGLITTASTGALTLAPSISTTNAAGTTVTEMPHYPEYCINNPSLLVIAPNRVLCIGRVCAGPESPNGGAHTQWGVGACLLDETGTPITPGTLTVSGVSPGFVTE
jgi:hypothetical protein